MALLLLICGCGGNATVRGTIRYQGRPVTHGSVTFVDAAGDAHSGAIGTDGSYQVDGVGRGLGKIGVISRDPTKAARHQVDQPAAKPKKSSNEKKPRSDGWFPLPSKYENARDSGLTCTVGSSRVDHDIDLP